MAAFREHIETVWGWDSEEQKALHAERFARGGFHIIAADEPDVGILALSDEPYELNVKQLFLLPAHQGAGIGRAVLSGLIQDAHSTGRPLRLRVLEVNLRALRFFVSMGLTEYAETETHLLMEWHGAVNASGGTA